jgi:hypothetical protein
MYGHLETTESSSLLHYCSMCFFSSRIISIDIYSAGMRKAFGLTYVVYDSDDGIIGFVAALFSLLPVCSARSSVMSFRDVAFCAHTCFTFLPSVIHRLIIVCNLTRVYRSLSSLRTQRSSLRAAT